jgi:branched-chain amino acid transport system ATP-binding protein
MPLLVEAIAEIIQTINQAGVTVLLVEQNVEMALGISHRAYIIEEGRIQFSGDAKDVLTNEEIQRRYLTI